MDARQGARSAGARTPHLPANPTSRVIRPLSNHRVGEDSTRRIRQAGRGKALIAAASVEHMSGPVGQREHAHVYYCIELQKDR